ncbi:hypothetical protein KVF89_11785 [Nocardioides carbamazepini]|uniref:hypothetical protein n=1 Tax=Nocardioides carbamazepini TaxID=2854259 RepID=UPI00214A079A|nr:hypothetical protein [Nocardioides carbamazepini]MCR1783216.1 hypothetical protein [Nocardioides carbamazepini]
MRVATDRQQTLHGRLVKHAASDLTQVSLRDEVLHLPRRNTHPQEEMATVLKLPCDGVWVVGEHLDRGLQRGLQPVEGAHEEQGDHRGSGAGASLRVPRASRTTSATTSTQRCVSSVASERVSGSSERFCVSRATAQA